MHFQATSSDSHQAISRLGQDPALSHSTPILGSNIEARPQAISSSNVEARPISGLNIEPRPISGSNVGVGAWPLSAVDTRGGETLTGNSSLPPPPPICRPYTSMQLPNVTDGYGQIIGSQGHPRVTTAPGFSGLTTIQRMNGSRLDHANQSLPRDPKKVKRRGKAIRPPGLGRRDQGPSIEDCIGIAMGGVEVVSIDILVYPPMPPATDINVCILVSIFLSLISSFHSSIDFPNNHYSMKSTRTHFGWFSMHWVYFTSTQTFQPPLLSLTCSPILQKS